MNKNAIFPDGAEKEYDNVVFEGLSLKGKTISSKQFYNCVFKGCDFTGTAFMSCKFSDCKFESCNLSLVKVTGSSFASADFKDSKLAGVNWTAASWPRVKLPGLLQFVNCVISDSNFLGLSLRGARVTKCFARGADFREADLSCADLTHTDFTDSLFGKTNLTGADLTRARNYAIRVSDNRVKDAKFSMPEAMSLLYCLDIKIIRVQDA
ncbi:MAG: hypothetical protein A2X34_01770 [Elusimicrobia bacterium GWC2_51_8]|nr:MAG: hypothetical protein A2X33_11535 [Elusimicrobia bacterium GWA2_51_34]OGR66169.1 MAG: hypothetical protein A2X34_01770 [Elusimicrobia bacterium GWC2_51_8]OGR85972.1 MAG: hypothetical protein A2021_03535 [Elusimicrobia bacterium GWF2_52_66]HAF96645.1 hypothetical protein [Elusimicrobiota bacterium]HCE97304.1 hypothetical protein [Elusimicrobiota bacterium]